MKTPQATSAVSRWLALALPVALLIAPASRAQQGQAPFFTIYQVSEHVFMLQAPDAGGNIGVLRGDDGFLLVDDRYEVDVDALLAALAEIGDGPAKFVINTHIHPDHIGGNARLAQQGAIVIAHESVRERMFSELRIPRRGGIFFPQPPAEARPVITYDEAVTLHFDGEEVRVWLAPPAHTGGDSFVHFTGADVLHLGDVFRTNMYPIIDTYNGGSFLGMIEAMDMAIGIAGPDTRVIPGHGEGSTDRAGMIEVQAMLLDMRDRVQALVDQGASLEEVLAASPLATYDARWGGVPTWTAADLVPIIYSELAGRAPPAQSR